MGALSWIFFGGLGYLLYSEKKLTLGDFVVEAKRKSARDPDTGGWAPGWFPAGRFRSRAEAEAKIKRHGRKGAKYRIKTLDGCGCGDDF
jgi:hypothetical protein